MKWIVAEFSEGCLETGTVPNCTCSDQCIAEEPFEQALFRVHWAPTVFQVDDELYTCMWASSLLSKKDIYERDTGLSVMELERRHLPEHLYTKAAQESDGHKGRALSVCTRN
jgi:hypothetical protein